MSFFLEEWVRTRLGASVDFSQVGNEFFDGKLFFKILQSYDVVGPEVKQYFCRAKSQVEALRNLNLLRVTFKLLGVLKNDDVLDEISRKNGSACVDLLNQLYLRLSNKHALPLVTKGKEIQVLQQETGRFHVSKVFEKKCLLESRKKPEEKLLSRLKSSIKVFEKNVCVDSFKQEKDSKYRLYETSKKAREEIEKKIKECKCGATVEDCLKKFDERLEQQAAGDYSRTICPPDEYVKMLKLRTLKQASDKAMESKLRDIIVKKIWCKQMQEREEEFQCSLAEKLLKQSNYEREMAQRLGQIHLQHRRMIEKRRQVHEEAQRIYMERLETIEWRKDSLTDLDKNREKQRLLDLHKKIFDERIAKKRDERLSMIKEVVNDIVDFSLKIIFFKSENSVQVSHRELKEWKIMFFKALPLLPKLQEMSSERLIDESIMEEESYDSFIEKDELVDEMFNAYALNEYLILLGPWTKELWPELENVEEEMDVLGFVVHRLLDFKYPLPQPPEPVDVPMYPFRVVINNIYDNKAMKSLKSLLEKPGIDVIELPTLINSSVAHYKKEMGLDVKPSKKKDKEKANPKKGNKKVKQEEPKFKSVEIQYPSVVDLEPKLSKFSELGKKAFEILGTGSPVPDELVTEILIEYLRNLTNREGWVLVNFPSDCRQVHYMETKFTGLEPPIKCIRNNERCEIENSVDENKFSHEMMQEAVICEDFSAISECDDTSKLNDLRTSRLLPRPNPAPPPIVFQSYFTNFIQLEEENVLAGDAKENKNESIDETNEDDLSKESLIEEQTPKSFYESTDRYLYFPYNKLDFPTMKRLARAIINESNEPGPERISSVELFGDIAKEKPKKEASKKAAKSKTAKKSDLVIIEASLPEVEFDQLEEITEPKEESIPCQVAEPCWLFTTLEIPDESKLALASLWESIELIYIQNLTELFSFYREHDACVVPYRNSVYRRLAYTMETPDERQELVSEFQSELNDVNDILRAHGDIKKEIFCRIFELQLKLWELCDVKKTTCETEKKDIISENWLPKHLCELFNIYVTMMETEIDRFSDSIQLLFSYYISSLGKPLPVTKVEKWYLPRYKISDFEIDDEDTTTSATQSSFLENDSSTQNISRKSVQYKRAVDVTLSPDGIAEIFIEILSNPEYDRNIVDPFTESINEIVSKVINEISNTANQQFNIIERERKLICPAKNPKSRAATTKKKDKKMSRTAIGKDKSDNLNPPQLITSEGDEEASRRETLQKALAEWAKGVQNEMDRTVFRLLLIKSRYINDLIELRDLMTETFHGLHNEISTRYFKQTRDCDDLLRVLMASVEAETKIEQKLVLTLDKFYIESGEISLVPPPPVTPIQEDDEDFTFTVAQLNRFAEKMILVSPFGISVESLIAIIEDMVLVGQENGYPYLPKGWSQLTRNEIRKAIRGIFGDIVMADWKDFLVLGLEFRFPSLQEIIEARDKFMALDPQRTETVNEADFNSISLWFEHDLCDTLSGDLRVVLGKQFLFDLFKVDNNNMNYTALLLNYCKDENPIDGFGKALALATGNGYVLSEEKLHLLITETEKAESLLIAEQIMNILLQDTLNRAEGIVITEVDDDGNPIKNYEEEYVSNDYGFFHSEKMLETAVSALESKKSVESDRKRFSRSQSRVRSKTLSKTKERQEGSVQASIKSVPSQKSSESHVSSKKSEQLSEDFQSLESNIVWKSWIPRGLVLSLILTSLQSYSLPEDQFFIQTEVEESLNTLYSEKGNRDCIQGHILAQSQFIKDLFTRCLKFKSCHLTHLIKSLMDSNRQSGVTRTL